MKKFSKSIAAISVVILICFTAQIIAANSLSDGNGAVRTVLIAGDAVIIILLAVWFFAFLPKIGKNRAENSLQNGNNLYEIQQLLLEAYASPDLHCRSF